MPYCAIERRRNIVRYAKPVGDKAKSEMPMNGKVDKDPRNGSFIFLFPLSSMPVSRLLNLELGCMFQGMNLTALGASNPINDGQTCLYAYRGNTRPEASTAKKLHLD